VTEELAIDIALPGDWVVIADKALADPAQVEALVGTRLDEVPELAPYRDDLVASVSNSAAAIERNGVLLTAVLAELTPDGRARTANLAVAAAPMPEAVEPAASEPASDAEPESPLRELERSLADLPTEDQVSHRRVESVLLSNGPAVRIARLLEVPLSDDGPRLSMLSVQYFFLLSETRQVVVLNFTTPSLGELPYLQGVFHAIANGFAIRA
jgi:hypothetical protein